MALKRMVMAADDEGSPRVIGPVYSDESVEKLRDQIQDAGWTNLETAVFTSVVGFRAELKASPRGQEGLSSGHPDAVDRAAGRPAPAAVKPPQLNRNPADATSAMLTMGFGQLMAAGAKARAFPTVYPGGAGAVVREAVTPLWSQVIPGAVADVLVQCAHTIVSRGGHENILDGWGNCPVAAEMLASTATWEAGGPVRNGVPLTSPHVLASSLTADRAREADVLHGTWVLLALAHQRNPEADDGGFAYAEDDGWDDTCDECGGELRGQGTYGCSCWNPTACDECGDPFGDCDCSLF